MKLSTTFLLSTTILLLSTGAHASVVPSTNLLSSRQEKVNDLHDERHIQDSDQFAEASLSKRMDAEPRGPVSSALVDLTELDDWQADGLEASDTALAERTLRRKNKRILIKSQCSVPHGTVSTVTPHNRKRSSSPCTPLCAYSGPPGSTGCCPTPSNFTGCIGTVPQFGDPSPCIFK
jgi:hypothetical protein